MCYFANIREKPQKKEGSTMKTPFARRALSLLLTLCLVLSLVPAAWA